MPGVMVDSNVLLDILTEDSDTLITRDMGRYRTYFPRLNIICPAG